MSTSVLTKTLPVPDVRLRERAFYIWSAAFIAGNLALPQLCHLASLGGKIFLPIYFFTLIGVFRCGWRVGIATALLSPLLNNFFFGMPPAPALAGIMVKSLLIVGFAALFMRAIKIRPLAIILTVLAYQTVGSSIEWALSGTAAAWQDLSLGWPGMLTQILAGSLVLILLDKTLSQKNKSDTCE